MLTSLTIRNYKSLHDVTIKPPWFFAIVGANAAGKSNFADAIEFLASVAKSGLASALTEKGGYENVCFRRHRRSKGAVGMSLCVASPESGMGAKDLSMTLSFSFRAAKEAIRTEYVVESESVQVHAGVGNQRRELVSISRRGNEIKVAQPGPRRHPMVYSRDVLEKLLKAGRQLLRDDELLTWTRLRGLPPFAQFLNELSRYRVFQIAPAAARRPGAASGNQEMGKHGDNLPAALEWLERERKEESARLLTYLRLAVPTIDKLETDYVETRELGLFVREQGMRRRMFASELSDGTLRTLAMFLPLADPRWPLVVIEEPENSVHPWVVRQFVDACRERSKQKQVILTTHSPVLVSKLNPSELFLAQRVEGETRISPASKEAAHLEKIIRSGIQDLGTYWDSGAMKAVPLQPEFDFMDDGAARK